MVVRRDPGYAARIRQYLQGVLSAFRGARTPADAQRKPLGCTSQPPVSRKQVYQRTVPALLLGKYTLLSLKCPACQLLLCLPHHLS